MPINAHATTFTFGTAGKDIIDAQYLLGDMIDGLGGDDIINGLDGNDLLLGGTGRDTISGNGGNVVIDGGVFVNDAVTSNVASMTGSYIHILGGTT